MGIIKYIKNLFSEEENLSIKNEFTIPSREELETELKRKNPNIIFYTKYDKEYRPYFNKYSEYYDFVMKNWSELYHSKDYESKLAYKIEYCCKWVLVYYKKLREIDLKYGEKPLNGSRALDKFVLLYRRRGDYEKAIELCKELFYLGIEKPGEIESCLKKIGREPNEEEKNILENCS